MSELNKEELRRLAEAATGGDWEFRMGLVRTMADSDGYVPVAVSPDCPRNWRGQRDMNMSYIAAANPATILSLLDENKVLLDQVAALQSDANSWQSGYDVGRVMGGKHRAAEVKQLTALVENLQKDADRFRWLSKRIALSHLRVIGAEAGSDTHLGVVEGIDAAMAKDNGA